MNVLFPVLTALALALFLITAVLSATLSLLVPLGALALASAALAARQPIVAYRLVRLCGSTVSLSFRYCADVAGCLFAPLSRIDPELDDGDFPSQYVRLKPAQLIELHRLQQQVASALGVDTVDELWVSAGTELGIGDAVLGGRRLSFLVIGLSLLRLLSATELRAALAHEYGHARAGHVRLGRFVRHAMRMLIHAQLGFRWFNPAFWGSAISLAAMRSIYLPWSRARELEADRLSARVAGREAATSALRKLREEGPALDAALEEVLRRAARQGCPVRLSESARALAAALPPAERRRLALAYAGDPLDLGGRTHPPIAARIAALRDTPDARPLPPASGLTVEQLDRLDERLTPRWLAPLALRPWVEGPDAVAAQGPPRELRKLTRAELEVPTSDGLELDLDRDWNTREAK